MTVRILFADDEPDVLEPVSYVLRREGWEVDCVPDGDTALAAARSGSYDLLLLDVIMPGPSGMDICRTLRQESDVPIIMVTARDAELDRVLGLELGADDYVTKPLSTAELVSRARALFRRRELDRTPGGQAVWHVGGLRLDLTRHVVEVDGRTTRVTPSEFRLVVLLAEQPGRVFTRSQIMEHLWDTPFAGATRACDMHVSNLRRKLERDPSRPERLVTVREIGYKLVSA